MNKIIKEYKKTFGLEGNFSIEEDFYPLDLKLSMKNFAIKPFYHSFISLRNLLFYTTFHILSYSSIWGLHCWCCL